MKFPASSPSWQATIRLLCLTAVLLWNAIATHVGHSQDEALARATSTIDFNRQVRPILSDKCFFCHGPDDSHREAELRLDLADSAFADRGGYSAFVPQDLDKSEAWFRISSDVDEDMRMPPADSGKELTEQERQIIRQWIEEGAEWQTHWAYERPTREANHSFDSSKIDEWIQTSLDKQGLVRAQPADRITLIRRLSFDLRGLPPTWEEVESFVNDDAPQAYEALVDRLLSSPHFGERMAVYWLDLVRYADTVGYHGDQDHNISPYRDYVIDAFNENLSFDQFTKDQLAGDLLPDPTVDQRIATGYNRLLQTSHEGGVQVKEYLAIYQADRVRNVSAVWMGATVGCAQCHSHKYDPYTIEDFYSLAAFFADVNEAEHFKVGTNALPTRRPPEIPVLGKSQRRRIEELDRLIEAAQQAADESTGPSSSQEDQVAAWTAEREALAADTRMTMITESIEPRTIRVLPRGNWLDDSGAIVEPAIPSFLGELAVEGRASRLDLANWLVDAQHGGGLLTARVMVNRYWYLLFGTGLSRDLADFGGQGVPPAHPELLDALAISYVDSGWDTKALLKMIVLSNTYRQSSIAAESDGGAATQIDIDPENEYFSRQVRRRLPAEFIRDNALMISGLLNAEIGGASVKPYQPAGYYQHLNFPPRRYAADNNRNQWRRGVYVHWQRQFLHPMLSAFDAPTREECTAQRAVSNTPLAALTLLNDPTFVESAKRFAQRILQDSGGTTFSERLTWAYRTAVSRSPDEFETSQLTALHAQALSRYQSSPESADALLDVGLAHPDRFPEEPTARADWAAWMTVARVILNLAETNTRP